MTMMKMYYYNINQNNFIMIKYLIIYNITIISATKSLIQPRKKSEKRLTTMPMMCYILYYSLSAT